MKKLVAAILLFSSLAQANFVENVFQRNTPLPEALKQQILETIQRECPSIITDNSLSEIMTQAQAVPYGSNSINYYYSSTFMSNLATGAVYITVASVDYGGSHPGSLGVTVYSPEGCNW